MPDQQIGSFAEDAGGTVIASYKNADAIGWLRIRDGKPEAMAFGEGFAATNHWHIVSGTQGEVWAATGQSVGLLRNGQFRTWTSAEGLSEDSVNAILRDSRGRVEAIVEQLLFLIQHHDQWPGMGRAGRAFVEARYDIRKLNRELVDLYAVAAEEYRAQTPEAGEGT